MEVNYTSSRGSRDYRLGFWVFATNFIYYVIFPYLIILLCFAGFGCNVSCVNILGRDKSTNYTTVLLLKMLAYADIIYLFSCILSHLVPNVFVATPADSEKPPTITIVIFAASDTAAAATIWIVVVVAFDRFLIVCRPQLTAKYSTMRRAIIAVCLVWIAMVIIRIPQFLEMFDLRQSDTYNIGYRVCFHLFVCKILPLSLLIFLVWRLRSSVCTSYHPQIPTGIVMSENSGDTTVVIDDKRQMTITLCHVCIVVVVLQSISTIIQMYLGFDSYIEFDIVYEGHVPSRILARMVDGILLVAVSSFKRVFYVKQFTRVPPEPQLERGV